MGVRTRTQERRVTTTTRPWTRNPSEWFQQECVQESLSVPGCLYDWMSERMVGSMLSPVLGTGGQFTWRKGQAGGPYKKLKVGRTRTQSSDSGCELSLECSESLLSSELFLDEVVTAWVGRVEGVLRQEEERAREVTMSAREALRQ